MTLVYLENQLIILPFFFSLLAEMKFILYANIQCIYQNKKIPQLNMQKKNMVTHSRKTNVITGHVNLLKYLRAKILRFKFLAKVSCTTYQ